MRISDWSSDVCSSDLGRDAGADLLQLGLCLVPLRHQFGIARSGANLQARVHRRLEGMVVAGELARRDAQALQLVVLVGELLLQAQQILARSEEHTSELQSLMRISYAVFCLKKKKNQLNNHMTD